MRKLIRNKIPEMILGDRESLMSPDQEGLRKMSAWEYPYALQLKLYEEWAEAWVSMNSEELGDCLQVLMDAAQHMGVEWEKVEISRAQKEKSRGGFDQMWELSKK